MTKQCLDLSEANEPKSLSTVCTLSPIIYSEKETHKKFGDPLYTIVQKVSEKLEEKVFYTSGTLSKVLRDTLKIRPRELRRRSGVGTAQN